MRKRIIVTGGSKGIGRAILEYFIARGFDIATCGRNIKELELLKSSLSKQFPEAQILTHACDVTNAHEIKNWCQYVRSHWDKIDILVNNAGTFLPGAVLSEPEENLSLQLDTNLLSAYRFTRELIHLLHTNNSGHIFNICSIASKTAYASGGAYTISKFALYGFSQCLREELKPTAIKVTAVLPGATWSDSWKTSSFSQSDMINAEDLAALIYQISHLSKQAVVEELIIRPQGGDL